MIRLRRACGLAALILAPVAALAQAAPTAAPCIGAGLDGGARAAAMIAAGWTEVTGDAARADAAATIAPVVFLLTTLPDPPPTPGDQDRLIARMTDPGSSTVRQVLAEGAFWARGDAIAAALVHHAGGAAGSVHCIVAAPDLPQIGALPPAPDGAVGLPADVWFETLPGPEGAGTTILTYIDFVLPWPTTHPLSRMSAETRAANFP